MEWGPPTRVQLQQQELFRGTHWALHWILGTALDTCVALATALDTEHWALVLHWVAHALGSLVYWSKLLAVVERDLFTPFPLINIDRISEICCRVQGRQKNV